MIRIKRASWPRSTRSPAPYGWPELGCLIAQICILGMLVATAVNAATPDYRWVT